MRTLLLADDSLTVQRVIALTFAEEPVQVVAVSDGREAMEKLAALTPDIILAGTTLPHVNGYDLAAFVRGKRELHDVPVLLLSGAFEAVDQALLKKSGANGVIEKPVEPTIVISRVKELLGLKADGKPAATGRLITAPDAGTKKLPVPTPPRAVTSTRGTPSKWEQLRDQTGLDANTRSVEDRNNRSDDYLGSLDDAFDTLDRQLSGREPAAREQRNPAGPLGQSSSTADPRSPGRRPQAESGSGKPGNPVFEVDDEWFGGTESPNAATARAGRQEIAEDLQQSDWQPPPPVTPVDPIYEVDEQWFADGTPRQAQANDRRQLADEMGIHDVDLPPRETESKPSFDLDFSIEDIHELEPPKLDALPTAVPAPAAAAPVTAAPSPAPAPPAKAVERVAPVEPLAPVKPVAPVEPVALVDPVYPVADDFAQLLAYEQGEHPEPPSAPAADVRVVTPEITSEMLDEIATRVADRLNASLLGENLRNVMTATVRDTVRAVVSETSERLVREEIDRIKNKKA